MTQHEVEKFISQLDNVEREENMGYHFFFVGDYHMVPFATIGYADNEGDSVSNLSRDGVFRVNIGISKETFDSLFLNFNVENNIDYSPLDIFMPHPHYAQQFYVCILNPSGKNGDRLKELIREAHSIATNRLKIRQESK